MNIYFRDLPKISKGKLIELANDTEIDNLITDTRKIFTSPQSVFIALSGERNDGHLFIKDAYEKGVRQFIVKKYQPSYGIFTDANFFEAENTLATLQDISIYRRSFFNNEVIGITGSNGKTIIKEWLFQLLEPDFLIAKSPKSYNSQIGVPLSVWQLKDHHNLGIFEAGISKTNEMEKLERIIKPTIGIFSNLGSAHSEGFSSDREKALEKLKLFQNVKLIIYCADNELIDEIVRENNITSFAWSFKKQTPIKVIPSIGNQFEFHVKIGNTHKIFFLKLPLQDKASIENMLHCIAAMLCLNYSQEVIQARINTLKQVAMRLEMKSGIQNCYLIDDSYNNDLAGIGIALDFANSQSQKRKKSIILSDLYESGISNTLLYSQINQMLKDKNFSKIIGVGPEISQMAEVFDLEKYFYPSTDHFLRDIKTDIFQDEVILIKGSRIFEFERIVKRLQQKAHRTILEINLDSLVHNLNFYKSKLKPETKIMVMVKSFAYGAGSLEVAQLLQYQKVDYLAVAYTDEAVFLRENGIKTPIMVMNPSAEEISLFIKHDIEPVIYAQYELEKLIQESEKSIQTLKVHLEVETGMNRLGLDITDLPKIGKKIIENGKIIVQSIFSHLAGADESIFNDFSNEQYGKLVTAASDLQQILKYKPMKHLLNSAGIVRFPQFQLDMVRLGVGLYGVEANGISQSELENVGTLKTTISQIKFVDASQTVGYSRKGKINRPSQIGIIAIGYGDGFSRAFSNGVGYVSVNGQRAKVIGNVCMDMTMIDLTDLDASEGDEVIVFGKENSIIDLAKKINTIPYELLTSVSERVKRVFYSA